MFCPKCGRQNDDNAWKCVQCGEVLQQGQQPVAQQRAVIPNYLAQSILVTIFCCWPFGIPAIVFSAQVNGKIAAGDIEGAKLASKNAKTWSWVSFGVGLGFWVIYLILILVGVVSKGFWD